MKSSNNIAVRDVSILLAAVLLIVAVYLLASYFTYTIGFPLDDSWIHQTYARNLALGGEWAFRPGIISAGSTAPLWSALLAPGFLFSLSPYIWTYFLGALILFALAYVGEWGARQMIAAYRPRLPWVGLFLAFEWHLAWAAVSGMETLLHALIVTSMLILLMTNPRRTLTLGLLTGLSAWIRPDGLTLLGPVVMTVLLTETDMNSRLRAIVQYLIGFGALFGPYLLFNLAIAGTPMPNTFYAKQAEYIGWQAKPVLERVGQMVLQLLVGPGVVLLPGLYIWLKAAVDRRKWSVFAATIWCVGYLGLYVSRLPVYQHGRYIMPAMPIIFLFGFFGFIEFVNSKKLNRYHWFAQTFWQGSAVAVTFLFVILGARSYSQDVALIESEMVVTAKWVADELPADAVIAAHDIGALGYFDDHKIIDLAGLISPEVIPFIRDEKRLAEYLNQSGAEYLIAFPDFYPRLVQSADPVFESKGLIAPALDQKNMAVFRWESP
jgi:hypothetical protein